MNPGNALYYGDNLEILRKYIADASVDLVYLDPPFNSNRDYNVLFKEASGESAQGQIKAFTDTWRWSEDPYHEFCETCPRPQLVELMQGFVRTLGRNDVTAYLVMMAPRLVELHRVLKETGSLYLHCDPVASHYLKLILDVNFGPKQFQSEIVWRRSAAHGGAVRFNNIHDVIFYYSKTDKPVWNPQYSPHSQEYIESHYSLKDENGRPYQLVSAHGAGQGPPRRFGDRDINPPPGRHWAWTQEKLDELIANGRIVFTKSSMPRYKRYLDDTPGTPMGNVWTDIPPVNSQARERLGYPTQKPTALLERIINASSNPGDTVLDPFCGCGTAITAAQKLGRRWIGIDVTQQAVALIKYRLADSFDLSEKKDYRVIGEPTTEADARALALSDRDEFQRWAVGLVERARPYQEKKGADSGIDGVLQFRDDPGDAKKVVLQVKSGHLGVSQIRDFAHVIEREKATLGLFISLDPPTRPMQQEADAFGYYTTPLGNRKLPRLQIRTVAQLLAGERFQIPRGGILIGIKQAEAIEKLNQLGLDFED